MQFKLILITLLIIFTTSSFSARGINRYKRYSSKKNEVTVVPFKSKTIPTNILKVMEENFVRALQKSNHFFVANTKKDFNINIILGAFSDNYDIYKLSQSSKTPYLIEIQIENVNNKYIISLKLLNIYRMSYLARIEKKRECQFEDVIFSLFPEVIATLKSIKFKIPSKCTSNMSKISGGTFNVGSSDKYDNNPKLEVNIKPFCIDKFEYPNKVGAIPETAISWSDANNKCLKIGKRLCTENEWERACKTKFNFKYNYANKYESSKCNTASKKASKSGYYMDCKGVAPVFDLVGNVNEWTGSNWDSNISNKVIRGGAWFGGKKDANCNIRMSNKPSAKYKTIGFRCCTSVK